MCDSGLDCGISKSKRKFFHENAGDVLNVSLNELPKHEMLEEKLEETNELASIEDLEKNLQELESNADQWDDPFACQLLKLLSHHLRESLSIAIERIVESGYSKEYAEQLVLRSGIYHGLKDVASNTVDGALAFTRGGMESSPSEDHVFQDLEKLVEFALLEMVNVLRQLKPCSSVPEAMWCLLLCDLNLWHALAVSRDQLGNFFLVDTSGETSSALLNLGTLQETFYTRHISKLLVLKENPINWACNPPPNLMNYSLPESLDISRKLMETHLAVMGKKISGVWKGSLPYMKKGMLRQKALCFEKNYKAHMSKSCFKAKLIPAGSKALDKAIKFPTGSSCVAMKGTFPRHASPFGTSSPILEDNNRVTSSQALQICNTSDKSLNSKSFGKTDDSNAGTPNDESSRRYIPKDEKEEVIQELFCKMKSLKKEIQYWTDWANEKVMQATRKLVKEQRELKVLRQEIENGEKKLTKENQTTEESSVKRLSEMEHALSNSADHIQTATLLLRRLEEENSVLKAEAEASNLKALKITSDLQETLQREQEVAKRCRSAETNVVYLEKERAALRHNKADVLSQQEIIRARMEQLEVLLKREEGGKRKCHEDALRRRNDIEGLKSQAKEEENKMRKKAESFIQRCEEDKKKLKADISERRSVSGSPKIAALLIGAGTGFSSSSIEKLLASSHQEVEVTKKFPVLQDNFGADCVAPERECIMCMTQEMCVVFLPCAHQILCSECNVLHEKQGLADCPSCRTPVQERIRVQFAEPLHP